MVTRRFTLLLAALVALPCLAAEKNETWLEVRSPNFTVVSTHNEKQARAVAEQFELFRAVAQRVMPKANFNLGRPLLILAVKNEKSLKELLPEYWEQKGRVHPVGLFIGADEKMYIALRTDVQGDFPYLVVYHEYVHALLRKNFENIPLWLNEGFAEFLGHTIIGNKEAGVGQPSEPHLVWLQSNKLLPLEVLLTVDHSSPHYNESNRASVFYAQAWALTHYLLLSERGRVEDLLTKYFHELDKNVTEKIAAQAALGDLKKFEKTLEGYVRQSAFKYISIKQPPDIDESKFQVRTLNAAESAAVRGDFHVYMKRPIEARALLEGALRADPGNALAHESLGLLALRQKDRAQAAQYFSKAASLDSRSYLAHYYAAMLNASDASQTDRFDETEASLKRSLELNPSFAPACSMLAMLYAANDERLQEALLLARKAVQLEPGLLGYRINLANVLMRLKRVDEAILIGERVLAAAKDPGEQTMASSFLQSARQYKDSLERYEAAKKDAEERAVRRAKEISEYEARMIKRAGEEANARVVQLQPGEMIAYGTISEVSCTGAEALHVVLMTGNNSLSLRAPRRMDVPYTIGPGRVMKLDPCKELRGHQAQVVYRAGKTRSAPSALVSVQLLEAPVTTELPPTQPQGRKLRVAPQEDTSEKPPAPQPSGRPGWSEGKITLVSCNGTDLRVTVDLGGGFSVKLRAANYHHVQFLAAPGVTIPGDFQPCTQLRGHNAEVKYYVAEGKGYEGDIVSIELRP